MPGASPQFGPEYFCAFVVNRPEGTVATPQSCNGKTASPDELAADPTQAATCTGGACPDSP